MAARQRNMLEVRLAASRMAARQRNMLEVRLAASSSTDALMGHGDAHWRAVSRPPKSLSQLMTDEIENSPVDVRAMIGGIARRSRLVLTVPLLCLIATATGLRMIPVADQSGVQILIFETQL